MQASLKRSLLFFSFLSFCISAAFAQKPLTPSRQSSYYTNIYKLTADDVFKFYRCPSKDPDEQILRNPMAVRTFLPQSKVLKKPNIPQYAENPQTIGEHIRKKRIQSGLLQKYLALLLNVSEDCITYWENGRSVPQIHHYPRIIRFLGYYPFDHETESFAGKLLQIRHCKGLSLKQCADLLSVSTNAAKRWERGKPIANDTYKRLIHSVCNELPLHQLQHPE